MIRRATSSKRVIALKEGLLGGRAGSSSSESSFASTSSEINRHHRSLRGISSFSKNNANNNAVKEVKKGTVKDSRSQRGIAGARKDASHSSLETSTTNKKKVLTKINNRGNERHLDIARRGKAAIASGDGIKPNAIDYSVGGTVYPVPQEVKGSKVVYQNADGMRVDDGRYQNFKSDLKNELMIPEERIITDAVKTYAYGTDASFYRLLPQMVVKIHSEEEVKKILPYARKHQTPVTFRAAGTSLSGQAVSDSVLLKLSHVGKNFRDYTVHEDGRKITLEPGLILGEVNRILQAHKKKGGHAVQYKMGPDPSSIDSCMVGGVVANNSSGMCCGVKQNTYHTLEDMRIVFVDGTVLDTADPASRENFLKTHQDLCAKVSNLATKVQADAELTALIKKKFAIKCTTGYSINALVDNDAKDPIEIIKRLMIGSERYSRFRLESDV